MSSSASHVEHPIFMRRFNQSFPPWVRTSWGCGGISTAIDVKTPMYRRYLFPYPLTTCFLNKNMERSPRFHARTRLHALDKSEDKKEIHRKSLDYKQQHLFFL
jgi:hypothetical protein